jgi:hypothetical protein
MLALVAGDWSGSAQKLVFVVQSAAKSIASTRHPNARWPPFTVRQEYAAVPNATLSAGLQFGKKDGDGLAGGNENFLKIASAWQRNPS